MDADQEMIGLGICNFMSSFVSAMPITGSFSRTAVNSASGHSAFSEFLFPNFYNEEKNGKYP